MKSGELVLDSAESGYLNDLLDTDEISINPVAKDTARDALKCLAHLSKEATLATAVQMKAPERM